MKKFFFAIATLFVMVLTAMSFTSCGDDKNDNQDNTTVVYTLTVTGTDNGTTYTFISNAEKIYTTKMEALGAEKSGKEYYFKNVSGSSLDASVTKIFSDSEATIEALEDLKDLYNTDKMTFTISRTYTNGTTTNVVLYTHTFVGGK